jgi:hypothetical protein
MTQDEPEWFATARRLEGIFMPSARERRDAFYGGRNQAQFVHYTTAEAALNIIRNKCIWMRNTNCMSDFKEIHHGREMLQKSLIETKLVDEFRETLDRYAPGVAAETFKLFDAWWPDTQFNTYISSISEHDEKENEHGRLSMWRAFGGNSARVAIVFNFPWLPNGSAKLNIVFSPVIYHDERAVIDEMGKVIKNLQSNSDFLESVSSDEIKSSIFNMLMASVVCAKHEGFKEEREWRGIYMPQKNPSEFMQSEVIVINGIPQNIYKVPLDRAVSPDLEDLDFANLFERLIIGPTQYPTPLADAFDIELTKVGVMNAESKITVSGIPIRT